MTKSVAYVGLQEKYTLVMVTRKTAAAVERYSS